MIGEPWNRDDETKPARTVGKPYCINCDYGLEGLTHSSHCPECGRPLVEVLHRRRGKVQFNGRRQRSRAQLFGMPVVHIATGPSEDEPRGKARGFIAIGDDAMGVIAIGGIARGGVACGGCAIGGVAVGGCGVGGVTLGGASAGLIAAGGAAAGGVATGGGALGVVAQGGLGIGVFVRAQEAIGPYVAGRSTTPNAADDLFSSMSWFFGSGGVGQLSMMQPILIAGGLGLLVAAFLCFLAYRAWNTNPEWEYE